MDERFALAGKGLWFLFLAVILDMAGTAVGLIPVVGGAVALVLSVASFALTLYGPWCAREAHPNFLKGFYASAGCVLISALSWFVPEDSVPAMIVQLVGGAVGLLRTYCILSAARDLLQEKRDQALAERADLIWKLVVGCMIAAAASLLLVWIPIINLLAVLGTVVAAVGITVAGILEIIFYYQAANSLKAA